MSAITAGVLDEDVHCHCHCLLGRCSRGPVRWCWWLRGKRQDTDMRQVSDVNDGPRRRLFSNWLTAVTCPGTITLRWMWGRSFSRKKFTEAAQGCRLFCFVFHSIFHFIFEIFRGSKDIKNKSKTALSTPYVCSSAHVRN